MNKAVLIISIASLTFFLALQFVYYTSFSHQIIRIVGEMAMIPSILFVIFAFVFSLIRVFGKKKEYCIILGINFFTILMITAATIADYQ